jgi:amino acid transporter
MSQAAPPASAPQPAVPQRQLTLFDSTCIIVGIIIGAGIYRSSPDIAGLVPNVGWLFGVWLLGGLLSFIGALCYAELGTAYPKSGGDYVYLTRAFGRSIGFIFAWAQLWIIRPGSIGAMAYAFAEFANVIWPQAKGAEARGVLLAYAGGSIVFFTAINVLGVRQGKWTQNVLTSVKVLGLGAIIVVGMCFTASQAAKHSTPEVAAEAEQSPTKTAAEVKNTDSKIVETKAEQEEKSGFPLTQFALAMVFVLFAYGGWNEMAYVGAEVRNPNKNILRAMLLGTIAVTAIYLLVNVAFIHALGLEGARAKTAPADMLALAFGDWAGEEAGDWAGSALALLVCISALGAVNGNVFTGARIYYAMGTEHRLYAWLGRWSGKRGTPVSSLLIQGVVTLALVLWFGPTERSAQGFEQSGFGKMVIFTTPAFWFFLMLVGLSVAELRWRDPDTARPYRTLWYPLPPIILCLFSMFMVYSSVKWAILNESWEVYWSMAILALGVAMSFLDPATRTKR